MLFLFNKQGEVGKNFRWGRLLGFGRVLKGRLSRQLKVVTVVFDTSYAEGKTILAIEDLKIGLEDEG